MNTNLTFEIAITLTKEQFDAILDRVYYMRELDSDEYIDTSSERKGFTVVYRNSKYQKKVRVFVNTSLVVNDQSNTDKLLHRINNFVLEYFDYQYKLEDFVLCGANFITDIQCMSRDNVKSYLRVLPRIGRVKNFCVATCSSFDDSSSYCLTGKSNDIDFLIYDLEKAIVNNMDSINKKQLESLRAQARGILRAEVRLTKARPIRKYTNSRKISTQIIELLEKRVNIFMDTFIYIIPFGDYYKKPKAESIIRKKVSDTTMRKKMIRMLDLIPEKRSIRLAQEEANFRNLGEVMDAFAKIHLSPITISKRDKFQKLTNIYVYMD